MNVHLWAFCNEKQLASSAPAMIYVFVGKIFVVEYSDLLAEHMTILLECTALGDCTLMGGV